jgi:hypothetical protein
MTNPFPGVDPFIEANDRWIGFHNAMMVYASEELNAVLPENYAAFIEERLELVDGPDASRVTIPDLSVGRDIYSDSGSAGTAVLTEPSLAPSVLTLPDYDPVSEAYIDIRRLPDQELVTSIELLSPTNKDPHGGSSKYRAKRADTISQNVNLVEIDLLLAGRRPEVIGKMPAGHFFAYISRASQRPRCDVYGWSLRDALRVIPIPLRSPDPDVTLDLALAFSMPYERNRYRKTLRYDKALTESFAESDRSWIASRIASK